MVPVVSLAEVIPCLLGGKFKHIEYIMCDAQGSDLSIMKGAGAAMQYVDKVFCGTRYSDFSYRLHTSTPPTPP